MSRCESEQPFSPPTFQGVKPLPSNRLFFGPLGLRAGWGILLFLALATVLSMLLFMGLARATGQLRQIQTQLQQTREAAPQAKGAHVAAVPEPTTLPSASVTEIPQVSGVLLAGVALALLERRRFGVYGLRRHHLTNLFPGALWGLTAMCLLIGLLRSFGVLVFDGRLLHGAAAVRFGISWLLFFLVVGLFEEFLFRGYVQFTLLRGLLGLAERIAPNHVRLAAFWMSALVWSILFLVVHMVNAGETSAGLASVFLAGILFSYALWRTGSLWWGIGFHMTWDWTQSFLFGVPDSGTLFVGRLFATHPAGNPLLSGGMAGPEGSLLMVPVVLLAFVILRLHPHATQPVLEPELATTGSEATPPASFA